MKNWNILIGRVLLGQLFLMAGINKIGAFAGTQAYMESMGVSGSLLIPVIALETGAGLAVILGWQMRWSALALAVFTIASAFMFHADFSNQMQSIMFMKNISIAGGLLFMSAVGAGAWSLDNKLYGHRGHVAG